MSSWDSQVSACTPFYFSFTVPLSLIILRMLFFRLRPLTVVKVWTVWAVVEDLWTWILFLIYAAFRISARFHSGICCIPYQRTISLRYTRHSVPAHAFTQVYVAFLTSACFHSGIRGIPFIVHIFAQVFLVTFVQIHSLTHSLRHTRHSFQMQAFTQVYVAFHHTILLR